ncbi:MAG: adenylate/guanylate cyclase domain-containing protein, partial [Pseudomonadales bacterium]|nr:adenylate/guanylate cyclase domain-containing protein [Pseudomonadales bacterium]
HIIGAAIYTVEEQEVSSRGLLPPTEELRFKTPIYKFHSDKSSVYGINSDYIVHSSPIEFKGVVAGYAIVVFSQDALTEQFQEQLYTSLIITALLLLVVTLGTFYIARKLSTPIKDLISATQSIREGKLDQISDRRNDELGNLIDAINTMSQGLIRKTELEGMLNRFLTKDVASKVMDQLDPVEMAGEHVEATVFFADIVGFTSISENIAPEEVQKLLNEYWSYYNACARFYFGTVDKYIGDCMMVVFGAPSEDPKHQYNAVACAILMQKLTESLNRRRKEEGIYPIELRIGINSGTMLAGLIGTSDRMEYTVVGDAVNLASRLCNEAESAQIIIEESLFDNVNPLHALKVEAFKEIGVRGKSEKVKIYSVTDIEHPYQVVMDDLISDILSQKI